MPMEIQVLLWDRHKRLADFNRLVGSESPPLSNTNVNKQYRTYRIQLKDNSLLQM